MPWPDRCRYVSALLTAAVLSVGCTESALYSLTAVGMIDPPSPPASSAVFSGVYCASDPEELEFPVKLLFVIDDSGSMSTSDADFQRLGAARQLTEELFKQENIFVGVEKFPDSQGANARILTSPSFTDDSAAAYAALADSQHPPGGGTPYLEALSLASVTIQEDILLNSDAASQTRYIIIFLSDGVPNGGNYEQIKTQVSLLRGLSGAGEITLHTAYLQNGMVLPQAWQLLQEMAQIGGGEARSFPNGDALDFSDYDTASLAIPYVAIAPLLVSNINARPGVLGILPDSDADGLTDEMELFIGSDPTVSDTDGDTCTDLLEHRDFQKNPTDPTDCGCSRAELAEQDEDGDLLDACTEELSNTDDSSPDCDYNNAGSEESPDGVIDYLEVMWGLIPRLDDARSNYDSDSVNNIEELKAHTDPLRTESPALRETLEYRYSVTAQEDSACYDFVVSNIALVNTLPTVEHAAGVNQILLYFIEAEKPNPVNGRTFKLLRKTVNYDPTIEGPQRIELGPDDFERLE